MMKEAKDVPKNPTKNPTKQNEKEGYDDPGKKHEEPTFNSVCISSLVFAFVGIGVLLSLATWSYITTMASVDDIRKPDHTKLHSHKHNVTFHRQNGGTDFISKMDVGTNLEERTDNGGKKSSSSSKSTLRNYSSIRNNVHNNITRPQMEPVTEKDEINYDVMDGFTVGSLGKRIESFSPSEIYIMKERLKNHRHGEAYPYNSVKKINGTININITSL